MHEWLPVYREAYNLLVETYWLAKQFSKDTKYTLGTILRESAFQVVRNISQSNTVFDKTERKYFIQSAIYALEDYRLSMRVGHDLHEISVKRFASITEKVESISKQLFAWHKSMSDKIS